MQAERARRVAGDFGLLVAGPFIGLALGMPIAVAWAAVATVLGLRLPLPVGGRDDRGGAGTALGRGVFLIVRRRGSTRHARLLGAIAAGCVLAFWGALALVAAGAPGD